MRVKCLRVISWLPVGGVERRLLHLLPLLREKGIDTEICCIRERGSLAEEFEQEGFRIQLLPFRSRLDPRALWQLSRLLKQGGYQVVHSHMYRSNVAGTIGGRLAGTPVVLSQIHNIDSWDSRRQVLMDRWLVRWREGVICVSEAVKRQAMECLGLEDARCFVIYNGIELEQYRHEDTRDEVRRELKIEPGSFVVITVGRLVEQKNHRLILKLAERLCPRYPELQFLWVGDGKLRERLAQQVSEKGLEDKVLLLGVRNEVARLLAASDVFLLPSYREGFANALLEAMAAGLPCVVSEVGGNPEALEQQKSGFLFFPDDLEGFSGALQSLIENDYVRRHMGEEARRRAERFSIERMANETLHLYHTLWEKKPCEELRLRSWS